MDFRFKKKMDLHFKHRLIKVDCENSILDQQRKFHEIKIVNYIRAQCDQGEFNFRFSFNLILNSNYIASTLHPDII